MKQGRKWKNRSSQSDYEVYEPKARIGSSAPVEPEVVTLHRHRSINRGISGMIHVGIKSYDNVHILFFLHSSYHPRLSIVTRILDETKPFKLLQQLNQE